jgi:hypothetical protein
VHSGIARAWRFSAALGSARRPEEYGTPDETLRSNGADVAAVEARRSLCEKKELARLKLQAAMPGRHRAFLAVVAKGERREPATDENVRPETTDAIARNGGNGFQEIGGARDIGSAMGQVSDWSRETHKHKVTDTWQRSSDPIQSNGNAGRGVPDEHR